MSLEGPQKYDRDVAPVEEEPDVSDAVTDHIVVQADPSTVLEVIGDYEAYPDWQPEIKEAEIVETDENGWGTLVRYRVDAKVFTARYLLRYTYGDTTISWELSESDQLSRLDGVYELTDLGDGQTDVSYQLEVVPTIKMPGLLRRQAAKRIVDGALRGLKSRVESRG